MTSFIAEYNADFVLNSMSRGINRFNHGGKVYKISLNNARYGCFIKNSHCYICGLRGTIARLEQADNSGGCTLNVYGREDGFDILFTKDHLHPKSLGGSDDASNLKTCCCLCNRIKDNLRWNSDQVFDSRRKIIREAKKWMNGEPAGFDEQWMLEMITGKPYDQSRYARNASCRAAA